MRVFLDTNVILDFYDSERGHYHFVLHSKYDKSMLYEKMRALYNLCHVTPIDATIIEDALSEERRDFEDAVQYFSSQTIDADIILTRDMKGFNDFDIPHQSPTDFLDSYFEHHIQP